MPPEVLLSTVTIAIYALPWLLLTAFLERE